MNRSAVATAAVLIAATAMFAPRTARAQQEFIRQRVLVHTFDAGRGSVGRRLGDEISDAIKSGSSGREVAMVSRWEMLKELEKAGYNPDSVLLVSEIRETSRRHRADEYVTGRAVLNGRAMRLSGHLTLTRDSGLKQPIASGAQPDIGPAAREFAAEVVRARQQLVPLRRCENAMRAGAAREAASAALDGISAYPRAVVARTCLLRAYTAPWSSRRFAASLGERHCQLLLAAGRCRE